jgi:hypothetical protein
MEYENSINYALEAANIRWKYYKDTGDEYHLKETIDWISNARIYLDNILKSSGYISSVESGELLS